MLRVQRLIPRIAPRLLGRGLEAMQSKRFVDWSFGHYLRIAHPDVVAVPTRPRRPWLAHGQRRAPGTASNG